jgi:hypothetical protein
MKKVDFYKLPRELQDRLLQSYRGEFTPKSILVTHGTRSADLLWLGLTGAAILFLVLLGVVGFGDIQSSLSRHSTLLIVVYIALASASAVGVVQAMAYRLIVKQLPWAPGVYVFEGCVVDAREPTLQVYDMSGLTDVGGEGTNIGLGFSGKRFTFTVDGAHAEQAKQLVRAASETMKTVLSDGDRRPLDPFVPLAVASPLAPTTPLVLAVPKWVPMRWLVAAGVGLFGVALFFARDSLSDERMFAWARAENDVATYKLYVAGGDAHVEEVSRTHLPRAELKAAVAKGTVESIDAFIEAYPETDIKPEVDTARATALVAVFETSRAKGTLLDLMSFDATYPGHHLAKFVTEAKHAIYVKALIDFKKKLASKSGGIGPFFDRLLKVVEAKGAEKTDEGVVGPTVEVRVQRVPSKNMDRADDLVMKSPWNRGKVSLPSRYLDDEHRSPHEAKAANAFRDQLTQGFSSEIVRFAAGAPIAGDVPKVTAPTLVVSYRCEPSGAAYASKKPRGMFIGLVFFYTFEFLLPEGGKPLEAKHTFAKRIPVKLLKGHDRKAPSGTLEKKIYDEMLRAAFEEAEKRYFAQWFKK